MMHRKYTKGISMVPTKARSHGTHKGSITSFEHHYFLFGSVINEVLDEVVSDGEH